MSKIISRRKMYAMACQVMAGPVSDKALRGRRDFPAGVLYAPGIYEYEVSVEDYPEPAEEPYEGSNVGWFDARKRKEWMQKARKVDRPETNLSELDRQVSAYQGTRFHVLKAGLTVKGLEAHLDSFARTYHMGNTRWYGGRMEREKTAGQREIAIEAGTYRFVLAAESEIEFLEACEKAGVTDPLSLSNEQVMDLVEGYVKVVGVEPIAERYVVEARDVLELSRRLEGAGLVPFVMRTSYQISSEEDPLCLMRTSAPLSMLPGVCAWVFYKLGGPECKESRRFDIRGKKREVDILDPAETVRRMFGDTFDLHLVDTRGPLKPISPAGWQPFGENYLDPGSGDGEEKP